MEENAGITEVKWVIEYETLDKLVVREPWPGVSEPTHIIFRALVGMLEGVPAKAEDKSPPSFPSRKYIKQAVYSSSTDENGVKTEVRYYKEKP